MNKPIIYFLVTFCLVILGCSNQAEVEPSNISPSVWVFHESVNTIDLEGIDIIDGEIRLVNTDATDLNFLSQIKEIRGALYLSQNKNLKSLNGLENLQTVESVHFSHNTNLTDMSALRDVQVQKFVALVQNDNIQDIELKGLSDPMESIYIDEPFESLKILSNLESVKSVKIVESQVKNLSDLTNLKKVDLLSIWSNYDLEDFCGIKGAILENDSLKLDILGNRINPTKEDIISECE